MSDQDNLGDLASAAAAVVSKPARPVLMLAEPNERLAAACIDVFAISVVTIVLLVVGQTFNPALLWVGQGWLLGHLVGEVVTGYTVGTRLVRIRVVNREGQPVSMARKVIRGLVRHLWLWLVLVGSSLAMMADLGWIDLSSSAIDVLHWAIALSWLLICGGSFMVLRESMRTLSDDLTGTFVVSDRRKTLAEARARRYGL